MLVRHVQTYIRACIHTCTHTHTHAHTYTYNTHQNYIVTYCKNKYKIYYVYINQYMQ